MHSYVTCSCILLKRPGNWCEAAFISSHALAVGQRMLQVIPRDCTFKLHQLHFRLGGILSEDATERRGVELTGSRTLFFVEASGILLPGSYKRQASISTLPNCFADSAPFIFILIYYQPFCP